MPCGIADHGVTSLERVTGQPLDIAAVAVTLATRMAEVFERDVTHVIAAD